MKILFPAWQRSVEVEGQDSIANYIVSARSLADGELEAIKEQIQHQREVLAAILKVMSEEQFKLICARMGVELQETPG